MNPKTPHFNTAPSVPQTKTEQAIAAEREAHRLRGEHKIDLFESLYLSIVTYTTVGYGDYLPMGWTRGVAGIEALSGMFLTPLFLIGLTRRYLRMR